MTELIVTPHPSGFVDLQHGRIAFTRQQIIFANSRPRISTGGKSHGNEQTHIFFRDPPRDDAGDAVEGRHVIRKAVIEEDHIDMFKETHGNSGRTDFIMASHPKDNVRYAIAADHGIYYPREGHIVWEYLELAYNHKALAAAEAAQKSAAPDKPVPVVAIYGVTQAFRLMLKGNPVLLDEKYKELVTIAKPDAPTHIGRLAQGPGGSLLAHLAPR